MKDLFLWFLVAFIAICACVISYRYGFTTGQAACPIKYAVCENGTCVLSDIPRATRDNKCHCEAAAAAAAIYPSQ